MKSVLKEEFEALYFRELSTVKGLEHLSAQIPISKNTLRRFLGKMKSDSNLSLDSLNTICMFLNYKDFEDFKKRKQKEPDSELDEGTRAFYDFLKLRKPKQESESVFQNINIISAEKIISNPKLLHSFFCEYKDSSDVLEYVLGWHPTYDRFAFSDYQKILLALASYTKILHFAVFANSIVITGKFLSENNAGINRNFEDLEKSFKKMKKEFGNRYIFPVARFAAAKLFVLFSQNSVNLNSFITEQFQLPESENFDELQAIVFKVHFADALNIIGKYNEAEELLKPYDEKNFDVFWSRCYPEKYKYLFSVVRMMALLGNGKKDEAGDYFKNSNFNFKDRHLTFDIASYIKLQYFTLGHFLDENNSFRYFENMQNSIEKTGFSYWNQIFERLKC